MGRYCRQSCVVSGQQSDIEYVTVPGRASCATYRERQSDRVLDVDTCTIWRVAPAELAAARIWIENRQRMLPCLVANRDLVPSALPQAIARFVQEPRKLLDIEREYSTGDPVLVRAAVFGLLHSGRVSAPELRTQPLSLLTSFAALEAQP